MSKIQFRVAFLGRDTAAMVRPLSRLSPAVVPVVYRSWADYPQTKGGEPADLIAVWPGEDDRPPFLLDVPILTLITDHLTLPALEFETLLLNGAATPRPPAPEESLLGPSPAMARVRGALVATARNSLPLLLTGENGTGKDLAAAVAHQLSSRAKGPLVAVNCGAIPVGLAETEFFGCVRGAFTGAENRSGFCQQAMGGTLFLDEVGELAPEIQAKLLRVLENKEIRRVGAGRVERADFRLVCATNRDLGAEVAAGRFREDLFYRINVLSVKLPALRDRLEDLPVLAEHFLKSDALEIDREVSVSAQGIDKLASYHWPGNVRQFRSVVLRAAVLHKSTVLEPWQLDWNY